MPKKAVLIRPQNKSLTLFLLLVVITSAAASSLPLTNPSITYQLKESILILEDRDNQFTIEDLYNNTANPKFVKFSDWPKPFEAKTTYWVKATVKNEITTGWRFAEWVVKFPLENSHIELYAYNEQGQQQHSITGAFIPFYKKTFKPTLKPSLGKITIPPGEKVDLFFKIKSVRPSIPAVFDIQLIFVEAFYEELTQKKRNNAFFLGFVLMMLLYNLFLFMISKDWAYVYYSFYLLTITGYTAYVIGDFTDWFHPIFFRDNPEYIYFGKLVVYLSIASYMTFIRFFMDLKNLLPTWDKILLWLSLLGIPFLITDVYLMIQFNFSPNISDFATIGYFMIFLVISTLFYIPLIRTRDKKGYFILVGLSFMGLGIFLTILMRFQSLDYTATWFQIGSSLEILVFSLGLAYRQRENEKAKQIAQFELAKTELLQIQERNEAKRLKELDTLKNHLYTNITHEFRTPLTVILGMAENILGNKKEKELILRNSKNLYQLIDQMMALAKLEAGKLEPNFIQANIINYLKYLTESFQSAAGQKNIQLLFQNQVDELYMDFNEKGILHIVQNLLSNAIKFTPADGSITLQTNKVTKNGQAFLQLIVQDNGLGIEEEDLPHIFNRFYQGKASKNTNQGTGIGLALTMELIGTYGGTITVQSQPNQGSTFKILLPITNEAEIVDPSIPTTIYTNEIPNETDHSRLSSILSSDSESPLVLLIEDNADVVTYIKSCLEDQYQVQIAKNGAIGIDKAKSIIPDIIISDVMMPEKDGFEVVKVLKEDQRTSHIPIVLLTARASEEDKIYGLEQGADAYLIKPFNKKELLIRIEKLIALRRVFQSRFQNNIDLSLESNEVEIQRKPEDIFVNTVKEIVMAQMDNPTFSIDSICNEIHLSRTQLYRKLKALTGLTPTHFIRSIRLKKALVLLQSSNKTIAEVAYAVGFNDPNYFSRSFIQEFGQTPSDIRK